MTLDEARAKFWKLKPKIEAAKALRKPFYDERNALAPVEAELRAKKKDIDTRREKAFSSMKLGGMELELAALARYVRRDVGPDPRVTPKGITAINSKKGG